LPNWKLLIAPALSNIFIIVLCFVLYGMNAEGAGAATRSTARFAICFFLAGFAAPGLRKWLSWYPPPAPLIQAFVAAQLVHFCSVILLYTTFGAEPQRLDAPQVVIVVVGFSIVLGVGLTASLRPQTRIRSAAYVVLQYVIWLILAADYTKHPIKTLRLVAIPVFFALVLRHLPAWGTTPKPLPRSGTGQWAR
jgi:hypothetical protein